MRYAPLLIALISLSAVPSVNAQPQTSVSSPTARTQCAFQDHTYVTVDYETMQTNGRKIFGGLVPYGKEWDMGSKQSPTFVTDANLIVGGKAILAGAYSLLTIPTLDKWTMIIKRTRNKEHQLEPDEVARIDLNLRRLPSPLESFAISFDQLKGGCVLNLRWEHTEASVLLAEGK